MEDHLAVVNLLMERCGAGKDVVHAWDSVGMVGGGEASIGSVFVMPMMEKSVLDMQGVGSKKLEKIFSVSIALRNTVWSKDLFLFVAGAHSNSCVDIASHHDLCVWVDGAENGIE
jgi:hypothetical protein